MNSNLSKARKTAMFNQVGSQKKGNLSVPPAKTYYESAKKMFSKALAVKDVEESHKLFLGKYYNLRLRVLTSALAKSGQGLAIAEPAFKGTYDYVLVLPLLHCLGKSPVDFDSLPPLMRNYANAQALSESCLQHFGLPFQAMSISKSIAKQKTRNFNEYDYYLSASKRCRKGLPAVAVECLSKAIEVLGGKDRVKKIDLKFDIVKIWLDKGKYSLAAAYSKELSEDVRGSDRYAESVWNYYYALSRSNNVDAILANVDTALDDESCEKYHSKLAYIKWWSLRRSRADDEQILAIEHKLLEKYSDNPMVAPIMLSRATDLLARQDYQNALATLEKIVKKYPGTKASEQAKKIQGKLSKVLNRGS